MKTAGPFDWNNRKNCCAATRVIRFYSISHTRGTNLQFDSGSYDFKNLTELIIPIYCKVLVYFCE